MFEPLSKVVIKTVGGGTPERNNASFWNGGIPWASVKDFKDGSYRLNSIKEEISEKGLKFSASNLIPAGTPIVCTRMAVGRIARADCPIAINQDLRALFIRDDYDTDYVVWAIDSIRHRIENLAIGSTVKGINVDQLLNFEIFSPPKPEQTKIAEILSTVDRAIEQTEALIAKQQRIKTGLMQDLLTRGIDEHGNLRSEQTHEFKDSPLGRIPVEWEDKTLSEVYAEIPRNGIFKTAKEIGTGSLMIGQTSFTSDRRINYKLSRRAAVSSSELIAYELQENDILVTRVYATVDGVGLPVLVEAIPEPAVYESNMLRLRVDTDQVLPDFVFYWLMSAPIRKFIMASVNASNQTSINQQVMNRIPIALPKKSEQQMIVNTLAKAEMNIKDNMSSLQKLRLLKTALMQDLLTGKKRVTVLLND